MSGAGHWILDTRFLMDSAVTTRQKVRGKFSTRLQIP